jgi:toxin ParE1/3/4
MPVVMRTALAAEDLLEIWQYVARDDEAAADGLLDGIEAACRMLAANPLAGRTRDELAQDVRSFPAGRYVVFDRPIEDGIVVLRVLHGARDLDDVF